MAEKLAFTNRRLADLPIPEKGTAFYLDHGAADSVAGLRLYVSSAGTRSFQLVSKMGGKTRFITLGKFPGLSVHAARKLAKQNLAKLAEGVSPNDLKKIERVRGTTLADVFRDYLADRKLADNTRANYATIMKKYLHDWQTTPLREISRDAVIRRHTAITTGTLPPPPGYSAEDMTPSPTAANKTMRVLRALFKYAAIRYGDDSDATLPNPVDKLTGLKKWNKESARDGRILPGEMEAWFSAVLALKDGDDLFSETVSDYLVFLLLTGLRRREASTLKWADVNLKAGFFTVWKTKNGEAHKLPLPGYLLTMLQARRKRYTADYVFPGPDLEKPINDPRGHIEQIRRQAGVAFTLHDLRRTFATTAESLDISHYALKRLLNHSGGRDVTEGHYVRVDVERLRKPMEAICSYFLRMGGVTPTATVVGLPGRAGEA